MGSARWRQKEKQYFKINFYWNWKNIKNRRDTTSSVIMKTNICSYNGQWSGIWFIWPRHMEKIRLNNAVNYRLLEYHPARWMRDMKHKRDLDDHGCWKYLHESPADICQSNMPFYCKNISVMIEMFPPLNFKPVASIGLMYHP